MWCDLGSLLSGNDSHTISYHHFLIIHHHRSTSAHVLLPWPSSSPSRRTCLTTLVIMSLSPPRLVLMMMASVYCWSTSMWAMVPLLPSVLTRRRALFLSSLLGLCTKSRFILFKHFSFLHTSTYMHVYMLYDVISCFNCIITLYFIISVSPLIPLSLYHSLPLSPIIIVIIIRRGGPANNPAPLQLSVYNKNAPEISESSPDFGTPGNRGPLSDYDPDNMHTSHQLEVTVNADGVVCHNGTPLNKLSYVDSLPNSSLIQPWMGQEGEALLQRGDVVVVCSDGIADNLITYNVRLCDVIL